ncbi:MAG: hypothetical protein KA482_11205 [Sphingobium sp.]|nr:hypothetical protein [Sphingobium sp.]
METITVNGVEYVRKVSQSSRSIVRCRNAGVHVGTVVSRDANILVLENANRIWRWRGANTLSEVAMRGVNLGEYTRISCAVPRVELTSTDVCEVIPVAEGVELHEVWND